MLSVFISVDTRTRSGPLQVPLTRHARPPRFRRGREGKVPVSVGRSRGERFRGRARANGSKDLYLAGAGCRHKALRGETTRVPGSHLVGFRGLSRMPLRRDCLKGSQPVVSGHGPDEPGKTQGALTPSLLNTGQTTQGKAIFGKKCIPLTLYGSEVTPSTSLRERTAGSGMWTLTRDNLLSWSLDDPAIPYG